MAIGAVNAQAYLGKDFEDQDVNSGGFTTQVVTGTLDWGIQEFSNNNFAKMSNFSGGTSNESESWYITPAVDLSSATSPIFSFANSANFAGADLEVFMSTDYDGTSAPSSASWSAMTANLSTGSYEWVNSGELSVSSTSATTYFAFKYTGTANDGKTWQVDSVFVAEAGTVFENTVIGTPATASEKTIYEIQSNTINGDESFYVDSVVTTGGIVTAVNIFQGDQKGYYIQSGVGSYSGIYVFDGNNTVVKGDSVIVTGTVDEFFASTQIGFVTNLSIVSNFNDVPVTLLSTAGVAQEEYESVLCQVVNANCTALPNNFDEWKVDDGSGEVFVADFLFLYSPTLGTAYNVTGVVAFAFSEWKLYPRDGNDVTVYNGQPVSINENNEVLTAVYPNPVANGNVTIEVTENTSLVVLDLLGNVVLTNALVSGVNTINVADLAAGNYIVKVGTSVQQLMVK